jgi:hypothetical protein
VTPAPSGPISIPPAGGIGQPGTGVPPIPGGPGGLGSPLTGNGAGDCVPEYPKVGQVAFQNTPNVPFPGFSVDVVAWLNWIGSILAVLPVCIANTGSWLWNALVDLVVPSNCLWVAFGNTGEQLRITPPISNLFDTVDSITTALGTGGAAIAIPRWTMAGVTIEIPFYSWFTPLNEYRGILFAGLVMPLAMGVYHRWRAILKPKQMTLGL